MSRFARLVLLCSTMASIAGCHAAPPPAIRSVQELGLMERPSKIRGRDGGVSGFFAGRSVWVYGDSVSTEKGTSFTTWRNNTMSWTFDHDASDGVSHFVQPVDEQGAPREFFPPTDAELAFNLAHVDRGDGQCLKPCGARYAIWGSGPVFDRKRDRAILGYVKVYAEPGAWNFHILGSSIAIWESFEQGPVRPVVRARLSDERLLFDESEGEFGIPAIREPYLYLFSCSGGPKTRSGCCLARALITDALDRDAWMFRAKSGWSRNVADAVGLFEAQASVSVHFNRYLNRWLAIYMSYGQVILRAAPQIDGPWSEEVVVYNPKEPDAIHAFGHPEFQEREGAVEYISYLGGEFRLLRVTFAGKPE